MGFIDNGAKITKGTELPPSSAQTRESTLGASAVNVYSPPEIKDEKIAKEKLVAGIGSLITIRLKNGAEVKVYISNETRNITQLTPDIQARLAHEKVLINPYNDASTHKQMNLAQILFGASAGDTITLHNGEKAEVISIIDLSTAT